MTSFSFILNPEWNYVKHIFTFSRRGNKGQGFHNSWNFYLYLLYKRAFSVPEHARLVVIMFTPPQFTHSVCNKSRECFFGYFLLLFWYEMSLSNLGEMMRRSDIKYWGLFFGHIVFWDSRSLLPFMVIMVCLIAVVFCP